MRQIAVIYLVICSLLYAALQCFAQVPSSHAGRGTPAVAAGFTGPIDINGTAYAFWSTRCGATAYTGNIADIWDTATGNTTETLLTCSAGGTINQTVNSLATTCAVSCSVKIIYDQSGSNKCGAAACDITNATNANRPTVTTGCLNSQICFVFNGSAMCLANAAATGQAQPYTTSMTFNRTGNVTTLAGLFSSGSGSDTQIGGNSSANQVYAFAGSAVETAAANDNTSHAMQTLLNGASSAFYIDGSNTVMAASPGTNSLATTTATIGVGSQNACGGGFWTGNWFEAGVWAGDKSANNATMNSNQHTYWNF